MGPDGTSMRDICPEDAEARCWHHAAMASWSMHTESDSWPPTAKNVGAASIAFKDTCRAPLFGVGRGKVPCMTMQVTAHVDFQPNYS